MRGRLGGLFYARQRVTTEGKRMADTHYIATLSDGSVEKLTCCDKYGHFKVGDKVTVTRLIKNVGRFIHIELFITSMKAD